MGQTRVVVSYIINLKQNPDYPKPPPYGYGSDAELCDAAGRFIKLMWGGQKKEQSYGWSVELLKSNFGDCFTDFHQWWQRFSLHRISNSNSYVSSTDYYSYVKVVCSMLESMAVYFAEHERLPGDDELDLIVRSVNVSMSFADSFDWEDFRDMWFTYYYSDDYDSPYCTTVTHSSSTSSDSDI